MKLYNIDKKREKFYNEKNQKKKGKNFFKGSIFFMALTEKQKAAQKTYTDKHNPIFLHISFKKDRQFGIEIQDYLTKNGLSANSYIKSLIKKDFIEKGIAFTEIQPGKPGRPAGSNKEK